MRKSLFEERIKDYEDYHAQYEAIETELEELEGLTSAISDEKEGQAHD